MDPLIVKSSLKFVQWMICQGRNVHKLNAFLDFKYDPIDKFDRNFQTKFQIFFSQMCGESIFPKKFG